MVDHNFLRNISNTYINMYSKYVCFGSSVYTASFAWMTVWMLEKLCVYIKFSYIEIYIYIIQQSYAINFLMIFKNQYFNKIIIHIWHNYIFFPNFKFLYISIWLLNNGDNQSTCWYLSLHNIFSFSDYCNELSRLRFGIQYFKNFSFIY